MQCLHPPVDPGLTAAEFFEVGHRMGLQRGEMQDGLKEVPINQALGGKLIPDGQRTGPWLLFAIRHDPDYLNYTAFEHIHV